MPRFIGDRQLGQAAILGIMVLLAPHQWPHGGLIVGAGNMENGCLAELLLRYLHGFPNLETKIYIDQENSRFAIATLQPIYQYF